MPGMLDRIFNGNDGPDYHGVGPSEKDINDSRAIYDSAKFTQDDDLRGTDTLDSAMAVDDSALRGAISARTRQHYGADQNLLKSDSRMTGMDAQIGEFTQNYDYERKMRRLIKAVQQRRIQAEQNKIAARNAVISGVLKTTGMVAGAYFGGIGGAVAGNQLGQASSPHATKVQPMSDPMSMNGESSVDNWKQKSMNRYKMME